MLSSTPVSLATVTLEFLDSVMAQDAIDCPGDTITYNCSIDTNTEYLSLTWTVNLPGQTPINVTYEAMPPLSLGDVNQLLDRSISTSLVELSEGNIQSTITFVVLGSYMNGTTLKCSIASLDSDMDIILINTSG